MYVTFYQDCKIQPNHYIENISSYLSKLGNSTLELNTSKEFISDKDNFSVRIAIPEKMIKGMDLGILNYCKLSTVDTSEKAIEKEQFRYYFVTGFRNISQFIYEFDLSLDVVNSYQTDVINVNNFKQVSIQRRHKDRWKMAEGDTGLYQRVYDEVDEGLGQVTAEVETNEKLTTDTFDICYEYPTTHNACSKYFTRVLPKTTKTMSLKQQYKQLTGLDLVTLMGKPTSTTKGTFLIRVKGTVDDVLKCHAKPVTYDASGDLTKWGTETRNYANCYLYSGEFYWYNSTIYTANGQLKLIKLDSLTTGTITDSFDCYLTRESSKITSHPYVEFYSTNTIEIYLIKGDKWEAEVNETVDISPFTNLVTSSSLETVSQEIKGRNAVTLVDSQIKSLQEVPASNVTAYYYGDNEAFIGSSVIKTNCTYTYDKLISWKPEVTTRAKMYESKLYGSYVRNYYLAYDNFTLPIQPEYLQSPTTVTASFTSSTDMTNTYLIQATNQLESKLYSNHLVCTRNNGIATYNDDYIEYVRNGYNYDLKQQTTSNIKNGLGVAASAIGTGFNIANKKDMGKGLGIFGIAQGVTNTLSSLSNVIMSGIENSQALANKRQQLLATSPSISGNSSLDIFNEYSGNALKFVVEKPTDEVLNNIYNLFYYTGYADNMYYSTMPTIKTRQYFNYVQADINYCNIVNPKERQRLINAYSNGITFEWNYNSTWLMNGNEYENWETSI